MLLEVFRLSRVAVDIVLNYTKESDESDMFHCLIWFIDLKLLDNPNPDLYQQLLRALPLPAAAGCILHSNLSANFNLPASYSQVMTPSFQDRRRFHIDTRQRRARGKWGGDVQQKGHVLNLSNHITGVCLLNCRDVYWRCWKLTLCVTTADGWAGQILLPQYLQASRTAVTPAADARTDRSFPPHFSAVI